MINPIIEKDEIIPELRRQIALPKENRPYMAVHTSDPKHEGGITLEGVRLDSLGSARDEINQITTVSARFVDVDHTGYIGTKQETGVNPIVPAEREIKRLEVFLTPRE